MDVVSLSVSAFWKDTNAEGLALAKEARWSEAERAFEDALAQLEAEFGGAGVTALAQGEHANSAHSVNRYDDARAQLLLNIGQSQFHLGHLEQARRNAERSCAIRVSLYGEESLIVARTRGDLAVILGASGLPDEAVSLLERAVSAVEKKRGEASAHLLPLLTNAARLLERASPERAKPFVARLKALQFAQQLAENAATISATELPSHTFADRTGATPSDDHYLRSAIAETVDLLRTTPSANIALNEDGSPKPRSVAVPAETTIEEVAAEKEIVEQAADERATIEEALFEEAPVIDNVEEKVDVPMMSSFESSHEPEVFEHPNDVVIPFERLPGEISDTIVLVPDDKIDDTIFDLVEAPPPTLSAIPKSPDNAPSNALGFEVQYGIPEQLHEPLVDATPIPTPSNSASADQRPMPTRAGVRAVGGIRRGSTQVVAPRRLWYIGVALVAFGAGIGLTYLIMPLLR